MSTDELLGLARAGDLEALGAERVAVADAVEAFARSGDAALACELAGSAWRIWFVRGELAEGSAALATALSAPDVESAGVWRVRALYADGIFAFRAGERDRSLARNEEALRIARELEDVRGECDALTGLARVALRDARYDDVVALAREARESAREVGDKAAEAAPLHLQAAGVRLQQEYAAARDLYLESLELADALGNEAGVAMEQHNLGWVELHLGNVDEAEARFRARDRDAGTDAYGSAWSNLNEAAILIARGDASAAAQRFSAGKQALDELGAALDPDDQFEFDWLSTRLSGNA
jgi:tetratricopeptide (TPR) repeat protein